jgi:DNA modification methylase
MTLHTLLQGDARVGLQIVPPGSVHCCVTSPPYFNQRDYRADGQIGQEETPADYVAALVEVCRGVFTVAGSMTVTDPERLQAYYKSGVRRGD